MHSTKFLFYICTINKKNINDMMNIENEKSQMRKGMLEYCVMLLLKQQSFYSSDIITKLQEANLLVVEGTLYPMLSRLKKEGLLDYEWRESLQGPPRKYYVLSEAGKEVLDLLNEEWKEIENTIQNLKRN